MDIHRVCALPGLHAVSLLPQLFGAVLRWCSLRVEGRFASHRRMFSAAQLSQLVPSVVSLRVRDFPNGEIVMFAQALDTQFARDVRAGLTQPEQKTLPCRYLYDEIG